MRKALQAWMLAAALVPAALVGQDLNVPRPAVELERLLHPRSVECRVGRNAFPPVQNVFKRVGGAFGKIGCKDHAR